MTTIIANLPAHQRIIVENAAAEIFTSRLCDFAQYVEDGLRPKREITDADVRHIVCAALVKYGNRRA